MSVEAGVIATIFKYLWMPFTLLIGWFGRTFYNSLKEELEESKKTDKAIIERLGNLENELNRNYYDKREIKEHIVDPLTKKLEEQDANLKSLTGMITEMIQDLGILKYAILGEEFKKHK